MNVGSEQSLHDHRVPRPAVRAAGAGGRETIQSEPWRAVGVASRASDNTLDSEHLRLGALDEPRGGTRTDAVLVPDATRSALELRRSSSRSSSPARDVRDAGASIELVLTAHNEEEAIGGTIREFLAAADRHALDLEVLVAEDGSSDRTREVVAGIAERSRRPRPPHPSRRSGRATAAPLRTRIAWRDESVIVCCDGDGQYDPDDLPRLLGALSPGSGGRGRALAASRLAVEAAGLVGVRPRLPPADRRSDEGSVQPLRRRLPR